MSICSTQYTMSDALSILWERPVTSLISPSDISAYVEEPLWKARQIAAVIVIFMVFALLNICCSCGVIITHVWLQTRKGNHPDEKKPDQTEESPEKNETEKDLVNTETPIKDLE